MTSPQCTTVTSSGPNQTTPPTRYHSMDALRGFALLLGVIFHAAESFCPERYSWAIVDINAHWVFDWFQNLSHSFRMELFFLIAGFFAHLVYHKRGFKAFAWNRFKRIALPFLIGWFLLYPLFALVWIWGAAEGGRLGEFGIPEAYQSMPAWKLTIGAFMDPNFIKEQFSLIHLWFLHQLLVIYLLVLLVRTAYRKLFGAVLYNKGTQWLDRVFSKSISNPWSSVIYPMLTVPVLFLMEGWGVDTPNNSLIPHLPTTLLYGLFFTFGWLLHRQDTLIERIGGNIRWMLALVLGLALSFTCKFYGLLSDQIDPTNALVQYDQLIYLTLYATMMWSFVTGFIGLFHRFTNKENAIWKYIADSSYWIYLIHHLVVVPFQILLANSLWPAGVKFMIISSGSLIILFASYHLLIRYSWMGAWLNGKKHERTKLIFGRKIVVTE